MVLIHFPASLQPVVKEENPTATFGEMGKLLGARWKELSEDDKAVSVVPFSVFWSSKAVCQ